MMKWGRAFFGAIGLAAMILADSGHSQVLTYPGCADLAAGDFRKTPIVDFTGNGRTKFEVAADGRIIAAGGSAPVSIYDPKTGVQNDAGRIPGIGNGIWGVAGFALDPDFTSNGRIFIYSTRPLAGDSQVSSIRRYTIKENLLDMASEKVLLEWGLQRNSVDHNGGGMAFDGAGNLHVGTGENAWFSNMYANINEADVKFNAMRSSANTNDLRGKIIRIKPIPLADADPAPVPGPGTTYEIPLGNLFPPGMDSTRAEIYVMGNRNTFSLSVDVPTGWVLWADVGPNATSSSADRGPAGMDEFNLATQAGNYGWPMFGGPNLPYRKYDYAARTTGPLYDSLVPINDSKFNTGMRSLPPPKGSLVAYTRGDDFQNPWTGFTVGTEVTPIAGPIYRYDGSLTTAYRLPPHLDGRWIVADYYMRWFKAIAVDAKGEMAVDVQPVFTGLMLSTIVDLKIGADGGMYLFEYSSQIVSRIEYTGTCLPSSGIRARRGPGRMDAFPVLTSGSRFLEVPAGFSGFTLFDQSGKRIWSYSRKRNDTRAIAHLPAGLENHVLLLRWDAR